MKYNALHAAALSLAIIASSLCVAQTANSSSQALSALPSKPLRLIVPYAAGGPVDTVARLVAEGLRARHSQAVLVDNKPGAGGNIGVDLAAKRSEERRVGKEC